MKFLKSPYLVLAGLICCMTMQPNFAGTDLEGLLTENGIDENVTVTMHPSRVIVRFKTSDQIAAMENHQGFTNVDAFLMTIGATRDQSLSLDSPNQKRSLDFLSLDEGVNVMDAINALHGSGIVVYAEPDYVYKTSVDKSELLPLSNQHKGRSISGKMSLNENTPNDPLFPEQWALENTGQQDGLPGADINILEAWEISEGTGDTVIAVLGDGIFCHEDLECMGERAETEFNRIVDRLFIARSSTQYAGLMGAKKDNETGMVGVNPNATIVAYSYKEWEEDDERPDRMNLEFSFGDFVSRFSAIIDSKVSGQRNIRIVFLDAPYNLNSDLFRDLVISAGENGILMIRGYTGSNRNNRYLLQSLPTNRNDQVEGGSADDVNDVTIAAPGLDVTTSTIAQTGPFDFTSEYTTISDSFASAAYVAGAASLILDHNPGLSPLGLKSLISQTGDPVASLSEVVKSGRRLNVANALNCEPGNPVLEFLEAPEDGFRLATGAISSVEYSAYDCGEVIPAAIIVRPDNGDAPFQLVDDGTSGDRIANDGIYSGQWLAMNSAENVNLNIQSFSPELQTKTISGSVVERPEAVNIELVSLLEVTGEECEAGSVYRFSTNSVLSSNSIDVLVTIGENQHFENFSFRQRCLMIVDGRLRAWVGDSLEPAFADLNYKIVEAGTNTEIKADSLLMTAFDLDTNDNVFNHDTDDILLDSPSTLLVSPDSEVTGLNGDFIDGRYTHLLKGTNQRGCRDSGATREITCSGAALWDSKGLGISNVNFRVQNLRTPEGNERLFDISFLVQDAIDLVNRPPVAIIDGFPSGGPAPLTGNFTAANSFDVGGEVVNYEWDFGDGTTANTMEASHTWAVNGIYTMILTVTDNDGASSVEVILVNVTDADDDVPPRMRLIGDNTIFLELDETYVEQGAVAVDDRDGPLEVTVSGTVNTGAAGITTITYTATDNAGNSSSVERIVIVDNTLDFNAPVISLNGPANISLDLNSTYNEQGATALDDRDGIVDVVINSTVDTSVAGEYIVSYTASDSSGNSTQVTRTVTVIDDPADTTPPVITLNGDAAITLEEGDAYSEAGASATDDTDGDVAVSISGNIDTSVPGVYTITYTATDEAGNTSSVTRIVTVIEVEDPDTVAPVITLNGDAAVILSVGDSYVEAGATAIDEVDGEVAVSISGAVDATTAGTYTLTYSAVDAAGNASNVSRVVTVNAIIIPDTTAPVVTLLGSSTISIDVGGDFTDPGATAMDDRDGDVAVSVDGSVDTSTAGTYTLTYSASDMAGNTGTATRTITVNTVIVPNVAPVANISSSTTAGLAPLNIDFDASGSSDSDGEIFSYEWDFGDSTSDSGTTTSHVYTDAGNYVVTLTVTDNEGSSSTATTTINVNADVEVVSYLKVVDTEGGYHHLKIGHNPDNLWKPKVSPADGNDTLSIRIRAESDIDWSKLELIPQSQDWRGVVSLGDYIDGNPEDWIDINIPLSDYPEGAFDNITLLSFFTRGIDPFSICIERIEFVGSNNFLWFGAPDKLDVAFDTPFNASVVTVDPSGPTHLQVIDTNGGWQHLKIGHNPDNLWNPKISPVGNNDSITIRVKAGDGVDWNKLQIIPQGKPERGRATLGDYLPANTDGWFDIVIPLADYSAGAFDDISLISIFGSGTDPFEIGLESIIFTGGDEFIWFGAPGTSSVSLETDWFTQLIVASQTEAAQSRMAKKGLLDIQEPAQEPAQAPVVEAVSTGGGGSLPLQSLFALMLLLGLRKLRQ